MSKKKHDFFWPSYADLMTSLFFIMLVLFVLTVMMLKSEQKNLITEKKEAEKLKVEAEIAKDVFEVEATKFQEIKKIDNQLNSLKENSIFEYLEECNKYIVKAFKGKSIFPPKSAEIKQEYRQELIKVGIEIKKMLYTQNKNNNTDYFLIIEGNVAIDKRPYAKPTDPHNINGYEISYKRALAVDELWRKNNIDLRQYGAEYLMAGSGFSGRCRDKTEDNNKRFFIQIIPKINLTKFENI